MKYIVIKETFQEQDEIFFIGSKEDCEFVGKILSKYHEYDNNISIEIKEEVLPTYKKIDDLLKNYEYKYTLEQIIKKPLN